MDELKSRLHCLLMLILLSRVSPRSQFRGDRYPTYPIEPKYMGRGFGAAKAFDAL